MFFYYQYSEFKKCNSNKINRLFVTKNPPSQTIVTVIIIMRLLIALMWGKVIFRTLLALKMILSNKTFKKQFQ